MKVYTRIEKYKDRSKPVDGNPCYEIETPKKHHFGIVITGLLIVIKIVAVGLYFALFNEKNTTSVSTVRKEIS